MTTIEGTRAATGRLLCAAVPVLAIHGLTQGPDGFDATELAAFSREQGWTACAEPTGRSLGQRQWRASVFLSGAPNGRGGGLVSGTTGHGATEAEALAVAVASMIRRWSV